MKQCLEDGSSHLTSPNIDNPLQGQKFVPLVSLDPITMTSSVSLTVVKNKTKPTSLTFDVQLPSFPSHTELNMNASHMPLG